MYNVIVAGSTDFTADCILQFIIIMDILLFTADFHSLCLDLTNRILLIYSKYFTEQILDFLFGER